VSEIAWCDVNGCLDLDSDHTASVVLDHEIDLDGVSLSVMHQPVPARGPAGLSEDLGEHEAFNDGALGTEGELGS